MPAAYMITDIVVSASTDPEAFGRVMVEGQSLGRMVIAPNHGGSQETILEGKTGWLFKPNDPESLAKTLKLVLSLTEKERGKVANTARKHVLENYSKEKMCSKTLEVYNELILSNAE
jgi:glycosyltransferase involved in cell wall biosynthesis